MNGPLVLMCACWRHSPATTPDSARTRGKHPGTRRNRNQLTIPSSEARTALFIEFFKALPERTIVEFFYAGTLSSELVNFTDGDTKEMVQSAQANSPPARLVAQGFPVELEIQYRLLIGG